VVQSVGHLTVNEDGVGSSPTAPANLSPMFYWVFEDFDFFVRSFVRLAEGG
jgi:hypothetical protein